MKKDNFQKDISNELVDKIRTISKDEKISIIEIANKTGIRASNVSRIFSKKYIPRIDTVILISDAIGCELCIINNNNHDKRRINAVASRRIGR